MKVLEELGQGKSLEDFPEIDNKNEDWKYISIPKDLNSFTTSQGSNQGSSSEEIDVLIHDEGIEIINENKSFQIILDLKIHSIKHLFNIKKLNQSKHFKTF